VTRDDEDNDDDDGGGDDDDNNNNLKTGLNSKNKVTAINTLAVPVLVLSFGIVNWSRK
jgi:ABC-type uncharacterized transport system involved in gliding motility auxiliary subunit